MNKYFHISMAKEYEDTLLLISKLKEIITPDTILVNCSPDYSSRLTQIINHKLSYLNKNELYDYLDMEMPYPNMSQVWSPLSKTYQSFDRYLGDWVREYVVKDMPYLFIDSGVLRGKNFSKVKMMIRPFTDTYKFASLYVQSDSIFRPDYYVEEFNKATQGGLLFQWENADNPNWDY